MSNVHGMNDILCFHFFVKNGRTVYRKSKQNKKLKTKNKKTLKRNCPLNFFVLDLIFSFVNISPIEKIFFFARAFVGCTCNNGISVDFRPTLTTWCNSINFKS